MNFNIRILLQEKTNMHKIDVSNLNRQFLIGFIFFLIFGLTVACSKSTDFPVISQSDLVNRLDLETAPLILDVRSSKEFASGHVPGALNIPYTELKGRLDTLKVDQKEEIVVYCERGGRASTAASILREEGFASIQHLEGHMKAWRSNKLPCDGC